MTFDAQRILNDPRWDDARSDPDRFEKARDRFFTAFLHSDPRRKDYFESVSKYKQKALRGEFDDRALNKYYNQYHYPENLLIPKPVSEEEQYKGIEDANRKHQEFLSESKEALKDLGGTPITDPGMQAAVEKAIEAKKANERKPGFEAMNPLTDRLDAEWDRQAAWAENRNPVQRFIDNAYAHSLPGKAAQLAVGGLKRMTGDQSMSVGDFAKAAASRGLNQGDGPVSRWLNTALAPIVADLPVFMLGKKLPPQVLLPAMDLASQGIEMLQGERASISAPQLLHSAVIGSVLRFGPVPPWSRAMHGGMVTRMTRHVSGTAVKAAEVTMTDPLFGHEISRESFASNFALFLAMESHRLIAAGAAGAIEGRLKRFGLTPKEASFFANAATRTQGNTTKLAETFENLTKNSWIEVAPPKGTAGKPVRIDRLGMWAQDYLKWARNYRQPEAYPPRQKALPDPIDQARRAGAEAPVANRRAYPIDQARRAGTEAPVANRRAYPSLPIKAPQGKARQWIVDSEGVVKEDWWRDAINHSEPRRILDWEAEAKTPEAKAYLTGFLAELEAAKNIAQGGGTGLAPTYEANRTLQEASITGWVNMGSVYPKGWNKAEYEKLKRAVNNINKGRPLTDAQRNNIEKALAPAMYLDEHFQRAGESDSKMANYVEQFKKEPFVPKGREPVTPGGLFYFDPASKTAIRDKGRKGPEVPNEAPPIEGFAEHQVPAQDDRMHSVLPMELPEINILATELMGGKHPKVRKKLGEAHGLFSAGESRSSANIALRADIFQVLTPYEKAALGKEAIEEVAKEKAVGEWTGFPSNDAMRRFASDNAKSIAKRYDTLKKEMENRVKFERSSPMARKTLLHEIGHLQDWLPDFMVQGRGNVFGHIAALRNYTLKMITEVPNNPEAAFSKKDRRFFRSQAQRATKRPPKNASKADLEAYRDNVSKLYKRILAREAKNRGVIFLDELKPELYNLHKWYRGVTEVDDYFKQPHELYADSFSAIMNNPGAVQKRAPLFWKLFWNYQETRPEAAQAYNAIQNGIKAGTVHRDLNINLRETMAAGDMTALQAQKASDHRTKSEYLDGLLYQVVRRTAPIHRRLMAEKNPNVRGPVLKSLNDYTHRGAGHELFMAQLNKRVYGKLDANNLDWLDLGVFLFHHRVIHERYGKANPFGFDAKSSTASLEEMRKTFGEDRYKAVEEAAKEFRALYDEHVVKLLDKYKILDPALQKYITDNIHYATFAATKGSAGDQYSIEAALKRRYGSATTGHIYRQIGNLGHIANPATATASKALSLISMAHREYSKRLAVEWLRESPYSNEVPDARTVFNGKARVPMMRNDGRIKTLVYMHKGEIKGVDMPRSLADSLQQGDPIENTLIAKAATMITRPVKSVYTGLNYGFWPVATIRDLQDVARKLPKAAFWGKRGVMKYAKQSYLEARSTLAGDDMLPGGEEALKRKFLVSVADNRGLNTQDQAFEQLLVRYHQTPQTWKNAHDRPVSGLRRAWLKYVNQGQILERTTKIMGMHYMDANFPDMPEWKKQDTIIHNAGTPNIKESAALNRYIDVFGLFYNPWKEGLISEAKAFKESNAEYAWKSIKYSLLPKAAMIAMAGGLLGKWLEDMFEAVPEYDKTNYIIVPLFWYDKAQKKLAYVRLPLSEYIRFTGGILWKLSSKIRGEEAQPASKGLFAYAGGQLPSGNPVSHVGMAWINYKLFGRNTPDDFTGYNILSNDVLDAQDSRTDIALAKWSYNQLTGNLFGRFEDQSIMEPERGRAEKFLRLPVVSNLIGRYIKISNRGLYDKYSIPIDKARQEDARDRLDTHEAVEAILSGNPLRTPIPITKSDSMRRMLGKAVISRTSPEMRILENARSRREKMMILDEMNRED